MNKVLIIIMVLLTSTISYSQRIKLKDGRQNDIKLDTLYVNTLLQVYDDKSAAHLNGDIYLSVNINNETAVDFYIDNEHPTKEYYTKAYKNLFLTFSIENNIKFLTIEEAQFEKEFTLSSNNCITIGKNESLLQIEISDFNHEWGYNDPLDQNEGGIWNNINYTLKTIKNHKEHIFNFNSSESKNFFKIDNYTLTILANEYNNSSALVNMIINKN